MFSLIPWRSKQEPREVTPLERNPLVRFREDMDHLFQRFFHNWPELLETRPWGVEVDNRTEDVLYKVELPGFEASDLDVQANGQTLTIRAEKKYESKQEGDNAPFQSREYRAFHRHFALPAGTKPDQIEATYRNGLLEVRVPKSEEAKGKRIAIKTG